MPTLQVQTKHQFNVGDPCLYEFREMQVERLDEDGYVTSVRDKWFSIGCGRRGCVFPVTERGLEITRFFKMHYDHLHKIDGDPGIFNWPDIAGFLEQQFNLAMTAQLVGDEDSATAATTTTNGFVSLATDYRNRVKGFAACGVPLIGRR